MTIDWTLHVSPEDLHPTVIEKYVVPFTDGRRLEVLKSPFEDPYSVRINLLGKKGSCRETFVLDRTTLEHILEMTKEI